MNVIWNQAATAVHLTGNLTNTGNITLNANGAGTIGVDHRQRINNTGTITNSGTGTGTTTISGGVGRNVTAITENSTTSRRSPSARRPDGQTAAARRLTNSNGSGTALFTVSGGVGGTGNLILNNNSATAGGITLSTTTVNNTGTITNSGTGTRHDHASARSSATNVTGVVQNSAPRGLTLSGANTFTYDGTTNFGLNIQAGTVTASTSASALGAGQVTLGNTTGSNPATLLVSTTGLTYANPIVLATNASVGTLTIGNTGTAISTTFSGGVTGTNNFTINDNATTGTITFSTAPINNAGTVTNIGAGTGATTISAVDRRQRHRRLPEQHDRGADPVRREHLHRRLEHPERHRSRLAAATGVGAGTVTIGSTRHKRHPRSQRPDGNDRRPGHRLRGHGRQSDHRQQLHHGQRRLELHGRNHLHLRRRDSGHAGQRHRRPPPSR